MSNDTESRTAVWPLALGAVAVVFGRYVPLPGVDYPELQGVLGQSGGFWDLSVGPIGNTINSLVVAYAFALGSKRSWAWRAALVFYLVCALVQGLGTAVWLESLNGGFGHLGGINVVLSPGWGFRLVVMSAYAAGGSVLWFIAKSIDKSRLATGALFLLVLRVFIDELGVFAEYGDAFALGALPWTAALSLLAMPLSVLVLAYAVYRRPTTTWPVTLWRWELQSHLDVIALVALSVVPSGFAGVGEWTDIGPALVDIFDALLALGIGAAASLWWWKHASAERAGRPTTLVAVVGVATIALLGVGTVAFVEAGGIERLTTPLLLAGDQSFRLTLDAEERFEPNDAEAMITLLEELGANAEVTSFDERSITLEVSEASSQDSVLRALTPVRFRLAPVLDIRSNAQPEVLQRGTLHGHQDHPVGDCAVFDDIAGQFQESAQGGCRFALERTTGSAQCLLYCLSDDTVLAVADIQDASVAFDEYEGGRPLVSVTLTEEGAQRFENYTANHIRGMIAIVVSDEVLSAPVIQSRISGGHIQISLGADSDYTALHQEAERLAAALRPGGIRTPWRLRNAE